MIAIGCGPDPESDELLTMAKGIGEHIRISGNSVRGTLAQLDYLERMDRLAAQEQFECSMRSKQGDPTDHLRTSTLSTAIP